jgi:chromosome segregation ATPase
MPIPDPTALTTAALYREVDQLKTLIEQRIAALKESVDSADDAIRNEIQTAIEARTVLDEEVQKRTDLQFRLVEQQRVEQKKDTKDAVDAALTAQKEAVKEQTTASERAIAKSETATNKQLEELGKRFETAFDTLRRLTDDVKERISDVDRNLRTAISEVDRKASDLASQKVGATTDRTGLYAAIGIIATLIFLGIAVATIIASRGGP